MIGCKIRSKDGRPWIIHFVWQTWHLDWVRPQNRTVVEHALKLFRLHCWILPPYGTKHTMKGAYPLWLDLPLHLWGLTVPCPRSRLRDKYHTNPYQRNHLLMNFRMRRKLLFTYCLAVFVKLNRTCWIWHIKTFCFAIVQPNVFA